MGSCVSNGAVNYPQGSRLSNQPWFNDYVNKATSVLAAKGDDYFINMEHYNNMSIVEKERLCQIFNEIASKQDGDRLEKMQKKLMILLGCAYALYKIPVTMSINSKDEILSIKPHVTTSIINYFNNLKKYAIDNNLNVDLSGLNSNSLTNPNDLSKLNQLYSACFNHFSSNYNNDFTGLKGDFDAMLKK